VRLAAFGMVWFFLTLSVESSLVPLADVIFEHRLYLPSVGAFMAFAVGLFLLREKLPNTLPGRLPLLAGAVVILVLTAASWQRNRDWRSEVHIWQDTVRKSPDKSRPWYNLGTHLTDAGRPTEAIPALARAVTLDPQHAEAWHNLGRSYLLNNQAAKAVVPLRTAVSLKPEMDNAVVNLAVALIQTRNPRAAIPLLEGIRKRYPEWPEVRLNLGIAYLGLGQITLAKSELAALQRIAPPVARELAEMIARTESRARTR
jgi:tetratricopeptide (TPR) repeat protein